MGTARALAMQAGGLTLLTLGSMDTEIMTAVYELRWMVVFLFLLVGMDFYYGVRESKARGEEFRTSRAIRRTLTKLTEYLGILMLGAVGGKIFTEPWGLCGYVKAASLTFGLGCLGEFDSMVGHWCKLHGVGKPDVAEFLRRFAVSFTKRKDKDAGEALEDALGDGNDNGKEKDIHEKD